MRFQPSSLLPGRIRLWFFPSLSSATQAITPSTLHITPSAILSEESIIVSEPEEKEVEEMADDEGRYPIYYDDRASTLNPTSQGTSLTKISPYSLVSLFLFIFFKFPILLLERFRRWMMPAEEPLSAIDGEEGENDDDDDEEEEEAEYDMFGEDEEHDFAPTPPRREYRELEEIAVSLNPQNHPNDNPPFTSAGSLPTPSTDQPITSANNLLSLSTDQPIPSADILPAPSTSDLPAPSTDQSIPSADILPAPSTSDLPITSAESIPVVEITEADHASNLIIYQEELRKMLNAPWPYGISHSQVCTVDAEFGEQVRISDGTRFKKMIAEFTVAFSSLIFTFRIIPDEGFEWSGFWVSRSGLSMEKMKDQRPVLMKMSEARKMVSIMIMDKLLITFGGSNDLTWLNLNPSQPIYQMEVMDYRTELNALIGKSASDTPPALNTISLVLFNSHMQAGDRHKYCRGSTQYVAEILANGHPASEDCGKIFGHLNGVDAIYHLMVGKALLHNLPFSKIPLNIRLFFSLDEGKPSPISIPRLIPPPPKQSEDFRAHLPSGFYVILFGINTSYSGVGKSQSLADKLIKDFTPLSSPIPSLAIAASKAIWVMGFEIEYQASELLKYLSDSNYEDHLVQDGWIYHRGDYQGDRVFRFAVAGKKSLKWENEMKWKAAGEFSSAVAGREWDRAQDAGSKKLDYTYLPDQYISPINLSVRAPRSVTESLPLAGAPAPDLVHLPYPTSLSLQHSSVQRSAEERRSYAMSGENFYISRPGAGGLFRDTLGVEVSAELKKVMRSIALGEDIIQKAPPITQSAPFSLDEYISLPHTSDATKLGFTSHYPIFRVVPQPYGRDWKDYVEDFGMIWQGKYKKNGKDAYHTTDAINRRRCKMAWGLIMNDITLLELAITNFDAHRETIHLSKDQVSSERYVRSILMMGWAELSKERVEKVDEVKAIINEQGIDEGNVNDEGTDEAEEVMMMDREGVMKGRKVEGEI